MKIRNADGTWLVDREEFHRTRRSHAARGSGGKCGGCAKRRQEKRNILARALDEGEELNGLLEKEETR